MVRGTSCEEAERKGAGAVSHSHAIGQRFTQPGWPRSETGEATGPEHSSAPPALLSPSRPHVIRVFDNARALAVWLPGRRGAWPALEDERKPWQAQSFGHRPAFGGAFLALSLFTGLSRRRASPSGLSRPQVAHYKRVGPPWAAMDGIVLWAPAHTSQTLKN